MEGWMWECMSTSSVSMLLSGYQFPTHLFTTSRDLKQGNHCRFLLTLVAEALSSFSAGKGD